MVVRVAWMVGREAWLAGPGAPAGWPWMDGQTGISSHSTGLCTLSGPLPKKPLTMITRITIIRKGLGVVLMKFTQHFPQIP